MYTNKNQKITYSPSDLTVFLESQFASWMEHSALIKPETKSLKDAEDAMLSLLAQKGNVHELEYLKHLKTSDKQVVEIESNLQAEDKTLSAMEAGVDIIFQAHLNLPPFKGKADFLVKVPGNSCFGSYEYQVWDTKLSKSMKPYFVVQLCAYAEMLASIQGKLPQEVAIVLGNQEIVIITTQAYYYYYLEVKQAFLNFHNDFDINQQPDPAKSRSFGQWSKYAEELLLKRDHLIQVANITRHQIQKLNNVGIDTLEKLSLCQLEQVKGIQPETLQKLILQANIQYQGKGKDKPIYKILTHSNIDQNGLTMLPPPSKKDVFFDIEGYPLMEGGLEYLWGNTYFDENGKRQFKDFWAHDHEQEKIAFTDFILWVYARWQQDHTMHIYHYASYEITAIRKLMQRYAVCEFEVDELLRNQIFIDLYKVVKASMVISEPRYSIKNVEHLYRGKRETEVGSGGDSVVVYEHWRDNPDGDRWQTSKILNDIREYNIDDCDSTQELVDWLRAQQQLNGIDYIPPETNTESKARDKQTTKRKIRENLLKKSNTYSDELAQSIVRLFAWLLEFHDREKKPDFWLLYERISADDQTLYDDINTLAYCTLSDEEPFALKDSPRATKLVYSFNFDPQQDFKGDGKTYSLLGLEDDKGKTVKGDLVQAFTDVSIGRVALEMKPFKDDIINTALIPSDFINTDQIAASIEKQALAYADDLAQRNCLLDFLFKRLPNIKGITPGEELINQNGNDRIDQIIQCVCHMQDSYLVIQGPPGSGKTYTGKQVIAELVRQGKKVGICSNSHKAIHNLLVGTAQHAIESGVIGTFIVTKQPDEYVGELIEVSKNDKIHKHVKPGCVIGTTVWGFAREDMVDTLDYLFIDEAGQVSLANYVAMTRCTKNIILMGDQMQLGQPTKASHPEESGLSVLDYLLKDQATISPDKGIFLDKTYRMHLKVNQIISDAIYEGKLSSDIDEKVQIIKQKSDSFIQGEAGIIYCPISHEGNTQASDEEVSIIVKLTQSLIGSTYIDKQGHARELTQNDILYVAPFNHQVGKLKTAMSSGAKVGSVDKFQGQEAPVVILSMCASSAEDAPRGLEFLFNKNRLNVAISRAQSLAIIVASDQLTKANASNLKQMELINTYCQLVDYAENKIIDS
jgi:uncharacterized protein